MLKLTSADAFCDVTYADGRFVSGPMGLDGIFELSQPAPGVDVALKGDWTDDQTFRMVSRNINKRTEIVYSIRFDGSMVNVSFESNGGFKGGLSGRLVQ